MQLTLSADLSAYPLRWAAAVDGEWLADAPSETHASRTVAELDLGDLDSARYVAVWLEDGDTCTLLARRPRGAKGQDRDLIEVQLPENRADLSVFDPRLSTEYDAAGQPRRFGLELWLGEDPEGEQHPWRLAGETVAEPALPSGDPSTPAEPPAIATPAGLSTTVGPATVRVIPMSAHASSGSGLALYVMVTV